jgi:biopolymer transport protein ExbD
MEERNRNSRKGDKKVKVDMNPMVDLAFLLLTFFMMATTFSKPQAMELIMPAKADKEEVEQVLPESKVISVVLGQDKKAHVYRGMTEPEVFNFDFDITRIKEHLLTYQEKEPEIMILIKPLDSAPYSHIVDVLDELNQMGMTKYVLMDAEDLDKEIIGLTEEK